MVTYESLKNRTDKIGVIGLGYVGLPLAVHLSKHFQVVLFGRIATLLPLFAKNNYRLTNLEPQQEAKRIIRQHLHKNHPKYPHRSTSASAVSIPKSSTTGRDGEHSNRSASHRKRFHLSNQQHNEARWIFLM